MFHIATLVSYIGNKSMQSFNHILSKHFNLKRYVTKDGVLTDTHYINDTNILMIDKICIYNKAFKNGLNVVLWRIEATISIPSIKYLALPLNEFKQITDLAKSIK